MCAEVCEQNGNHGPYAVYDPCCGGGTLLTGIALLNPQRIYQIVGSDLDPQALETAHNNLQLLTAEGANNRCNQIESDYRAYGKEAHREALRSACRIRDQVRTDREANPLILKVLELDATELTVDSCGLIGRPDVVLADVPYGIRSDWKLSKDVRATPMQLLLSSLLVLPGKPVVGIAADKKTRIEHGEYRRLARFSAGKRQIVLLTPH